MQRALDLEVVAHPAGGGRGIAVGVEAKGWSGGLEGVGAGCNRFGRAR